MKGQDYMPGDIKLSNHYPGIFAVLKSILPGFITMKENPSEIDDCLLLRREFYTMSVKLLVLIIWLGA